MLEDIHKQTIQKAYSAFLENKSLKSRSGQKQMIAEIARALGNISTDNNGHRVSDPSVTVIEAGTGTGKTVGYLIPTIIMAQAAKKTLIISSATITLQEQIISKDLPDIIKNTGLEFSFALAKGRGRYACLNKLDQLLQAEQTNSPMIDLFADEGSSIEQNSSSKTLYMEMLEQFSTSRWLGDRDSWPDTLENQQWQMITTDHAQCSGKRCGYFNQCPFYRARKNLEQADIVVTNHDLVMADLVLGGGAILPAPKDCLYVFDEGHHLPSKAINHFACHSRLKATSIWLEKAGKHLQKARTKQPFPDELDKLLEKIKREFDGLIKDMGYIRTLLSSVTNFKPQIRENTQEAIFRFPGGILPEPIIAQAKILKIGFSKACTTLEKVSNGLKSSMDGDGSEFDRTLAEQFYPEIGAILMRLQNQSQLWQTYTIIDSDNEPPSARWLKWSEGDFGEELEVFSSPILSANTLSSSLWNNCYASVVTSATLASLGNFDRYRMGSGIPVESLCVIVPSPFIYANAASLVIPAMNTDPRKPEEHTSELIAMMPDLLSLRQGSLTLFSSRRQMKDVYNGVPSSVQKNILVQDDYSRQVLLKRHRETIDKGESSILFGLASLAEGIDLPGSYCEHVIIARIPFAVPNDPVEAALAEWLEAQGRNPFMEITVPDAVIHLVQACGRLLRTEKDTGQITLLDRRVITQRYGQMILNSLPPFTRKIENKSTHKITEF
ncbi:MAG: ATP-dependent DNA helicase DinG [Candidatus Endonucleobacter bathymodioli]|uniref:ATP-dependent DNA helicase DinG n=1 Tax=Candidatus Endonucleibacter bathymodioli TaxID=539814 RepID=A0AA90SRK5_9GAMM|nr:ATP-dependent DNA helicase DinG [Candidatus Endonucleobacter bathymodioli]